MWVPDRPGTVERSKDQSCPWQCTYEWHALKTEVQCNQLKFWLFTIRPRSNTSTYPINLLSLLRGLMKYKYAPKLGGAYAGHAKPSSNNGFPWPPTDRWAGTDAQSGPLRYRQNSESYNEDAMEMRPIRSSECNLQKLSVQRMVLKWSNAMQEGNYWWTDECNWECGAQWNQERPMLNKWTIWGLQVHSYRSSCFCRLSDAPYQPIDVTAVTLARRTARCSIK